MSAFTDHVEYERPEGKKVRIAFELYRNEILFHFCQFRHDENSEWEGMKRDDEGFHTYVPAGSDQEEKILFPTPSEIALALDEINKKYNLLDV